MKVQYPDYGGIVRILQGERTNSRKKDHSCILQRRCMALSKPKQQDSYSMGHLHIQPLNESYYYQLAPEEFAKIKD